jgi:hypothetical protein
MTARATFTEAELRRVTKVAAEAGKVVEIEGGVIRIVDAPTPAVQPAPKLLNYDTVDLKR